jgi:outer membrane protein assembly factor BamE
MNILPMSDFSPTLVRAIRMAALAALAAGLGACGTVNRATQNAAHMMIFYEPEVVQGNFVSKEQVAALKPGMTRLQVRDALGTPLLASPFHGERWDYVFTIKRQGVAAQSYHLTAYFNGDTLDHFDGDDMPSETEFVQRISRKRDIKVPPLEATDAQLAKFPPAAADAPQSAASAPAAPAQPSGSYPPLEPAS